MIWSQNIVELVRGGKSYFEKLINLIDTATESIHLQSYIFDDDETGTLVVERLKSAVRRNVQVYFLADGYASQIMSRKFIEGLTQAGINFRYFDPIFKKSQHFYFGRRMHQKVFVADARCALVGSINIANRYNDMPDQSAWLDFSLYVEGEVARQLCILCWKTWNNFHLEGITPCEENIESFDFNGKQTYQVCMARNDWVRRKNEISATYNEMLEKAKSHVTIMCSYFIPGKHLRQLLESAARRGVKITVIAAGPSDVWLAKYSERWLYERILRNKISLFEYKTTVLHAKVAVCDSEWLTLGSYNVNDISAYASIELNLNVRDASFASQVEHVINEIKRKECIEITERKVASSRNPIRQFSRWLAYHLYITIFTFMTIYFRQEKLPN